jgi:Flp pilus assembly protein TadG
MAWRQRIREDRRGVAALEFALLLPALVTIMLSVYDITNAVMVWWQLSAASAAIARIATTFAAQTTGTNSLTTAQATTAATAIFAVMPNLSAGPPSVYGVTITSVVMTPTVPGCTANCSYIAHVAWSLVAEASGTRRACGTLTAVPDGSPYTSSTLRASAFSSSPLLVVDVSYAFTPLFNTLFGTGMHLMESAYMATRTGGDADWTQLTGAQAAQAQCPGYTG